MRFTESVSDRMLNAACVLNASRVGMARHLHGGPGARGTTRVRRRGGADHFHRRMALAATALDAESTGRLSEDEGEIADRTAHRDGRGRLALRHDEDLELHQRKLMATAVRSVIPAALWPAVAESTRAFTTSAFR